MKIFEQLGLMAAMKIFIKNMVCDRCKFVIKNIFEDMQLSPLSIEMGAVDFGEQVLTSSQLALINQAIVPFGFEVIDDKKSRQIEKIKKSIIDLIQNRDEFTTVKLSDFLQEELHRDYSSLSHLFSSVEGTTIEQYLINQKIEKIKELIIYDELNLGQISARLGYSSLAHLSGQFKKVTGLTPTHFKRLRDAKQRLPLDKL